MCEWGGEGAHPFQSFLIPPSPTIFLNSAQSSCLCKGLTKSFAGQKGGQPYPGWKTKFTISSVSVHMKAVLGFHVLSKWYIFIPEMWFCEDCNSLWKGVEFSKLFQVKKREGLRSILNYSYQHFIKDNLL